MGQSLKSIIKVTDQKGNIVKNANVTLTLRASDGQLLASLPATFGSGDVYRTDSWMIPHKIKAGDWIIQIRASTDFHMGTTVETIHVKDSINEILMNKYGFWIDSPTLRGIVPSLVKERGDARNGLIAMGGIIPAQHVFPENWLEVQWREGNFNLETTDAVSKYIMNTLGNPGIYPLRSLVSIQRTTFKTWDAWLIKSRSELSRYDEQWMLFYAPESNKTYAIGTTVVLAPTGVDAHAVLRDSFDIHPEIQANGVAPVPLEELLAPAQLVSPNLGTRFLGTDQPIILTWKPIKELADNEYYLVNLDYNFDEANISVSYTTRNTSFTLPDSLYSTPNCGVFNWQITLMKQTGTRDGQPTGIPLSFRSLYWYVMWLYPSGTAKPFNPLCPNEQF